MIDPCALPETGWGWLALVTISLTLLGLGVAFVALPRRSWMALVGAAAMAVVGIGGATSVDAQSEECYSIMVVNAGHGEHMTETLRTPVDALIVCEVEEQIAPGSVGATGITPNPSDNCVEFPAGSAIGAVRYLEIRSALSAVVAVSESGVAYDQISLWGFDPSNAQVVNQSDYDANHVGCGVMVGNSYGWTIGSGDSVWVGSNDFCPL